MTRWFNVAGPCNEADHYMLPVMRRLPKIRRLIERKSYFVLHAPRQVGKTTALLALGRELTAEGRYVAALLFLDEIDALQGQPLISILRQLRAGYPDRPGNFPWSLALVGLRDVRDYKVDLSASTSHSASPFNIKDASLTLRNFSDDLRYVQDLGLVRAEGGGGLVIANPIYREVIPRSLAGA